MNSEGCEKSDRGGTEEKSMKSSTRVADLRGRDSKPGPQGMNLVK
jgi:hypothetical protein